MRAKICVAGLVCAFVLAVCLAFGPAPAQHQAASPEIPPSLSPAEVLTRKEYIKIEIKGILTSPDPRKGPYTVTADGWTWALDLGNDKVFKFVASNATGMVVVVTGTMKRSEDLVALVSRIEPQDEKPEKPPLDIKPPISKPKEEKDKDKSPIKPGG